MNKSVMSVLLKLPGEMHHGVRYTSQTQPACHTQWNKQNEGQTQTTEHYARPTLY